MADLARWRDLRRLARGYRGRILGAAALSLFGTLLALTQPLLARIAVDGAVAGRLPWPVIGALAALFAAQASALALARYVQAYTGETMTLDLRREVTAHLLRVRLPVLERGRTGDLIARACGDTAVVKTLIAQSLGTGVAGLIGLIAAAALLAWLDPWLLAAVVVLFGGSFGALLAVVRRVRIASRGAQAAEGALLSDLERVLGGIRVVRACRAERAEAARLDASARRAYLANLRMAGMVALSGPANDLAVSGAFLAVLLVGASRVSSGAMTLGELVGFTLAMTYLAAPVYEIFQAVSAVQQGSGALHRINELLALPLERDRPIAFARVHPPTANDPPTEPRIHTAAGGDPPTEARIHTPAGGDPSPATRVRALGGGDPAAASRVHAPRDGDPSAASRARAPASGVPSAAGPFRGAAAGPFRGAAAGPFRGDLSAAARARAVPGSRPIAVAPVRGAPPLLEFRDVWFGYDPGRPILRGIDFTVPSRGQIALVGPSGAGKSTIFALAERFYDPDRGTILLNGRDARHTPYAHHRATVGLVEQDCLLLAGTLRENLLYGATEPDEAELRRVLTMTGLTRMVATLPLGLDTPVGERGRRFSGGQRQRIAIARCLLSRPSLILLDEPTAHLDPESERALSATLREVSAVCALMVIAHRFSTVRTADRVLVIDGGVVTAAGTHAELSHSNPYYRSLQDQNPSMVRPTPSRLL